MEIFNIDELPSPDYNTCEKMLFDKVISIGKLHGFTRIVTNGNVASSLVNNGYTKTQSKLTISKNGDVYPLGYVSVTSELNITVNIDIFVDPFMRWNDHRIIFSHDIKSVRKNKINKVFGKKSENLSELVLNVIDTKNILL